jgi:hypothetical protein
MRASMLPWNYLSAGCAFCAAIAWLVSATCRIPDVPTYQFTGVSNAGVPAVVRAVRLQSRWSAIAAGLAAFAAVFQGLEAIFR